MPTFYTAKEDYDSLRFLSMLKFSGYQFVVKNHYQHSISPSGALPCLFTADSVLADFEIRDCCMVDNALSPVQASKALAYSALCSQVALALEYELWLVYPNYDSFSVYPWPLNSLVMWQELAKRRAKFAHLDPAEIYSNASKALRNLSLLLNDRLHYFDSPSSIDANVFALVHTIMTRLAPESKLRSFVTPLDNLLKFANRMWQTWYFCLTRHVQPNSAFD